MLAAARGMNWLSQAVVLHDSSACTASAPWRMSCTRSACPWSVSSFVVLLVGDLSHLQLHSLLAEKVLAYLLHPTAITLVGFRVEGPRFQFLVFVCFVLV